MPQQAAITNDVLLPSGKSIVIGELFAHYPEWLTADRIREIHTFLRSSGLTWSALEGLSTWAREIKNTRYGEDHLFAFAFLGAAYWNDIEPDELFNRVSSNSHILFA